MARPDGRGKPVNPRPRDEARMTPRRIQRHRTKGWRMPAGAIYVGRPSRWGNPWRTDDDLGRGLLWDAQIVTDLYRIDLMTKEPLGFDLAGFVAPLRDRDLMCWCPLDQPCHADVLLELANR